MVTNHFSDFLGKSFDVRIELVQKPLQFTFAKFECVILEACVIRSYCDDSAEDSALIVVAK